MAKAAEAKGRSPWADPARLFAMAAGLATVAGVLLGLDRLGKRISGDDPIKGMALAAALVAAACTPVAFAVLGRIDWFQARRGRTYQRPEFWSICCGMALCLAVPAIFAALVIKGGEFDKDRYEFDPNKTWSVLDQGRAYESVEAADKAVREREVELNLSRKNLVENVKKLDEAMLVLRAAAGTSPEVARAVPDVLQRLAGVRRSVGVDGPQQLMDFTAPPEALLGTTNVAANAPIPGSAVRTTPAPATASTMAPPPTISAPTPVATATAPAPAPAATNPGALTESTASAELAEVPAPQKGIAAMLPLVDVPAGWVVGKAGAKHLETINADNLFEKIDGRAESFLQYDVKGMAYTYYHPAGDESNEVQLYIFQLSSDLNALGKYGSEKPEGPKLIPVGTEGYEAAGSTLFYAGPYYTQIVSTRDDPTFSAFALELARKVNARQKPAAPALVANTSPGSAPAPAESSPEALFAILPATGKSAPKYIKEDAFGYSFLSAVFMADYKEGSAAWQGFIRPYPTPEAAREVFDKYLATAKQDGATVKPGEAPGADQYVLTDNVGLFDAVFRRGNVIAGANGATDSARADAFARSLLKGLPAVVPPIKSEEPAKAEGPAGESSEN